MERLRLMMKPYQGSDHSVVGVYLERGETSITAEGTINAAIPAGERIFEIGSITKVFTAILLYQLAEDGRVDPCRPLNELSDALADVPRWITPERLISHTSGLPNLYIPLWKALLSLHPEGPYAEFNRRDLIDWFHRRQGKSRERKFHHAYSNLGVGLLGEALAMREQTPFAELLAKKVIKPLGLTDTTHRLDDSQRARFAPPKLPNGLAVSPWTFQALAAAGCLKSSASDLARLSDGVLKALQNSMSTLDRAICKSTEPILGLGKRGALKPVAQCAGWLSYTKSKSDLRILHASGGTAGSTCALYICPEKSAAIAILSNNGVAASLWGSLKLSRSDQLSQAMQIFHML
ncbi:MAG: beta-lactamase family protein [Hyphomonas sp.]|nr:beta-lactamase family protein [Hyphomonas sp.]